ncbi:pilus assembly protein [Streptomyces sp. NA02950]|uniref:TadE/TadG family type IV pilus assembly protein n=1 Tax=Streptomyces sp. NA02950 TaxID=2742137 RepID=UPI00158FE228|nr:TadE/TadG family type IV pilus assembly protein [Streptomyces sp. NA02950]QKV95952.1 pilus assembly protein [Streptomyces sp. NA02950]
MHHLLRTPRPGHDDRGAATTQLVLTVPALLILALLIVQFALAWHARHLAHYTAERALAAARVQHGTAAQGQARGLRSLAQLGSRVLTSPSVTVRRTPTQATVRVHGTASGAVERITTPAGGPS